MKGKRQYLVLQMRVYYSAGGKKHFLSNRNAVLKRWIDDFSLVLSKVLLAFVHTVLALLQAW